MLAFGLPLSFKHRQENMVFFSCFRYFRFCGTFSYQTSINILMREVKVNNANIVFTFMTSGLPQISGFPVYPGAVTQSCRLKYNPQQTLTVKKESNKIHLCLRDLLFSCSSFLLPWWAFSAWNPVAVTVTPWANHQGRAFVLLHSAWSPQLFWWELWVGRRGELSLGGRSGFQMKLYLCGTRGSPCLQSLDNCQTILSP